MATEIIIGVSVLIGGISLLAFSSDKAVEHSVRIASALGVSPFIIGLLVVSLGTDLPEILNSVISSGVGHGDINVGDSFGSVLAQMTLVLGLVALLGKTIKVKREEIVVLGACEFLTLIASISMVEKGYISRMNAFFLVASWPILMIIIRSVIRKEYTEARNDPKLFKHLLLAILYYVGVAVGSYLLVNSVIVLSAEMHVSEYFISFFVVAIGTSLPELAVDLTAVRKKQYGIAIGDAIGSSIIDAGFSIGIGPLLFPIAVSGRLAETTGLYALIASVAVISIIALRRKLDKKTGMLCLILYGLSYAVAYV